MERLRFKEDLLKTGSLAGIGADIINDLLELGFQKLNLIFYTLDELAGSLIIHDLAKLNTFVEHSVPLSLMKH